MNRICIVQARMGSSRLPGKVLKKIKDKTIVELVYERVCRCSNVDKIIFAIPNTKNDEVLEKILRDKKIPYYIGSEKDVLERYYMCAKEFKADFIIRVTCDCPLVDYETIDMITEVGIKEKCSYIVMDGLPIGVTAEAFTYEALEKAYDEADKPYQREHVISYFLDNPKIFYNIHMNIDGILNRPKYRFTLDTNEDFDLIEKIYEELYRENQPINVKDVIKYLEKNKFLLDINKFIVQKSHRDYL